MQTLPLLVSVITIIGAYRCKKSWSFQSRMIIFLSSSWFLGIFSHLQHLQWIYEYPCQKTQDGGFQKIHDPFIRLRSNLPCQRRLMFPAASCGFVVALKLATARRNVTTRSAKRTPTGRATSSGAAALRVNGDFLRGRSKGMKVRMKIMKWEICVIYFILRENRLFWGWVWWNFGDEAQPSVLNSIKD